jgi:hypothetical protein
MKCDWLTTGNSFKEDVNSFGDGDIVIGANNLGPDVYEGTQSSGYNIKNGVLSNTKRYAYIYKDCDAEHLELAQLFVEYCQATLS